MFEVLFLIGFYLFLAMIFVFPMVYLAYTLVSGHVRKRKLREMDKQKQIDSLLSVELETFGDECKAKELAKKYENFTP